MELSEAILTQADLRTRNYPRRSTIFSNTVPSSILSDSVYNTHRDTLFFGERLPDFGIDCDDLVVNDNELEAIKQNRIGFFGSNFDDMINQKIADNNNDDNNNDTDSNRSKLELIMNTTGKKYQKM
jgi:hypothetical protein